MLGYLHSSALVMEKLLVGVLLAWTAFALLSSKRLFSTSEKRFWIGYLVSFIALRMAVFVLFFLVFGTIRQTGDVPEYYYPQAQLVLGGQLPYRDFPLNYGPLFPYICAAVVSVWRSPAALVLFSIVVEIASVVVWVFAARSWFPEQAIRKAAILYLTSLLPFANVGVSGQNQVWISLFLAGSVYLAGTKRDALAGTALGLSVVVVKFLGLLFAPLLMLSSRRKFVWISGLLAVTIGTFGILRLLGADPLMPLKREAAMHSPGNISFLLTALGFTQGNLILEIALSAILAGLVLAVAMRCGSESICGNGSALFHGIAISYLLFALFSPKSYTYYAMMCFFPLCVSVGYMVQTRAGIFPFALLGTVLVIEPNLWQAWFQRHDLTLLWTTHLPPKVTPFGMWAFVAVETVVVSLYCYYCARLGRVLFAGGSMRLDEAEAVMALPSGRTSA